MGLEPILTFVSLITDLRDFNSFAIVIAAPILDTHIITRKLIYLSFIFLLSLVLHRYLLMHLLMYFYP